MNNSDIIKEILKVAEENHINLYHDVSKHEIQQYIKSIKNINKLNNVEFDYEMLKVFSKFKDAHTTYFVKLKHINCLLYYIENKLLLKDANKFYEVIEIGDITTKEFIKKIEEMINYETQEYLFDKIRSVINNFYYYEMLGMTLNNEISLTIRRNGKQEKYLVSSVSLEEYEKLEFVSKFPNYSFKKIISDNVLYISYKSCFEDKDYAFSKFIEDLKQEIETNNITKYILDLRDNHGGNSSVIHPLIDLIKEKRLNGALIINNGVFSSGRWAVADFKKNFNTLTFGEPTGGAAASYGYNKNLQVEDKRFSVSIRYWDFSEVFGSKGPIVPDVYVPTKIKDLKKGIDYQLQECLNYVLNKNEENEIKRNDL